MISGRSKSSNEYDCGGETMAGGCPERKLGRDKISGGNKAGNRNDNGYQT